MTVPGGQSARPFSDGVATTYPNRQNASDGGMHGADQLLDGDPVVRIGVEAVTVADGSVPKRDVDRGYQLAELDLAVAIAIAGRRLG